MPNSKDKHKLNTHLLGRLLGLALGLTYDKCVRAVGAGFVQLGLVAGHCNLAKLCRGPCIRVLHVHNLGLDLRVRKLALHVLALFLCVFVTSQEYSTNKIKRVRLTTGFRYSESV